MKRGSMGVLQHHTALSARARGYTAELERMALDVEDALNVLKSAPDERAIKSVIVRLEGALDRVWERAEVPAAKQEKT